MRAVLVSIARVALIAAVVLIIGGCDTTVSLRGSLNTTFGPGKAPETYRVGPTITGGDTGERVIHIRSADSTLGFTPSTRPATGDGAPPAATTQPSGN